MSSQPQGLDAIVAVMQARLAVLDEEATRIRRALAELNGAVDAPVAISAPPASTGRTSKAKAKAKPKRVVPIALTPGSRLQRVLVDVREHSDTTSKGISQRTGIDDTSVTKMLGKLRDAGLIVTTKGATRGAFSTHRFADGGEPAAPAPKRAAPAPRRQGGSWSPSSQRSSRADQILADLKEHGASTGREISGRLGVADTDIYNNARKLVDAGLVLRDEKPGNKPSTFRLAEVVEAPAEAPAPAEVVEA